MQPKNAGVLIGLGRIFFEFLVERLQRGKAPAESLPKRGIEIIPVRHSIEENHDFCRSSPHRKRTSFSDSV